MRPAVFSLFLLISLVLISGCAEDSSGTSDGGFASEGGDEDSPGECNLTETVCDGNDVLTCVDGLEDRTPCEDGSYCNYGECLNTAVLFPEDAGYHADRSEWWYYTGHLSDGAHRWGFEVTIFQYDIEASYGIPGYGYMCHVAITDKEAGEHYHIDSMSLIPETWTDSPIVLELDNCLFLLGGDGKDHITGHIPEGREKDGKASPWKIDLSFDPQKKPAFHGGDGIIPMGDFGGSSWYYSYTRLFAAGTLSTPEGEYQVEGQAWMDHQWGQFDIVEFKGWDWWSMQFEDGFEVMLFQFTNWDGVLVSQAGTLIDPEGNLTELEGLDAFSITPLRTWESPHTDGTYPLDWDISIEEMDWIIEVRTSIDDQEMYNLAQNYWEGETVLTGTRSGQTISGVGYTELTGYASDILDP